MFINETHKRAKTASPFQFSPLIKKARSAFGNALLIASLCVIVLISTAPSTQAQPLPATNNTSSVPAIAFDNPTFPYNENEIGSSNQTSAPPSLPPLTLAGSENALSLFEQGKAFHDGDGETQDFDQARSLYVQAASLGNTNALLNLGYMYFTGEGVDQNYSAAKQYYERAATAGDLSAQKNLAMMYKLGLGVQAHAAKADEYSQTNSPKTPSTKVIQVPNLDVPNLETPHPEASDTPPSTGMAIGMAPSGLQANEQMGDLMDENILVVTTQKTKPETVQEKISGTWKNLTANTLAGTENSEPIRTAHNNYVKPSTIISGPSFELLRPASGQKVTRSSTRHFSPWVSTGLAVLMLSFAIASAIWFVLKMIELYRHRSDNYFVTVFFEQNRNSIRGSYLRTPTLERLYEKPNDPWAIALCSMMIKAAMERVDDPDIRCPTSQRIVKELQQSAFDGRMACFKFVDLIHHKLAIDIEFVQHHIKQAPRPLQFPAKTKRSSPVQN